MFLVLCPFNVIIVNNSWAAILIGHSDREPRPNVARSNLAWPSNINMWEYSVSILMPHIIWSTTLVMFMWGAYHADCRNIPGEQVQIYRATYVVIIVLDILALFLFYIQHNAIAALVAHIFSLVLLTGLIFMYSEIDIHDAWFTYPYFLWNTYIIYLLLYAIKMNQGHSDMRNFLFSL